MFTPRFNKSGMLNSPFWYTGNPFYDAYPVSSPNFLGLPNCTCYAWGRVWEIEGINNKPTLPLSNGGDWWNDVRGYRKGSTPELGAVLCLEDPNGAGHVAVVEAIDEAGNIKTSNSGYSRPASYDDPLYFWVDNCSKLNNYVPSWAVGYKFQGFIYLKNGPVPPTPETKKMKLMYYIRPHRLRS